MVDGVELPQDWDLVIEPVRPIHQCIEQQEADNWHVGLGNLSDIRSKKEAGDPGEAEQTDDDGHKSRQQTHER